MIWRRAALALLLLSSQANAQPTEPPPVENEILLYEVTLDQGSLTDALQATQTSAGLLLPISELARLLDINLDVDPRGRRIVGRVGPAQRPLIVDLATDTARLDGRAVAFDPGEIVPQPTDILVSTRLIERLLPLRIAIDNEALEIALTATEQLPIQSRLDRLARLRGLQPEQESREEVLSVASAPALLSMPAFDIALDTAADSRKPRFRRRYDVRVGADVLYTGFQGYVGSDERGKPSTARLLFERRDPEGDMFGPLGLSRFSLGDVYTPALAVGPRGIGGRGVSISTAPLEQASVFDRIDLRGELPIGYDVELYINDVLRRGQQTPVQGRYEFLNVPLVRGVNVIRVVSYGPRGERFEETRVVNVGGGALSKGETTIEAGIVQQDRSVVDLEPEPVALAEPGYGDWRGSIGVAHGLTETLTLVGGAAIYSPGTDERGVLTLGARTSLLGYAVQTDLAYDDSGGRALALGLAGSLLGASTVIRHSEYRQGFIDEALPSSTVEPLRRHSEANLDFNVGPIAGLNIPLSIRALRDEYADGRVSTIGGLRLSTSAGTILLSGGLDYDRTTTPGGSAVDRLTGVAAASAFIDFKWQLRASLDYDLVPTADIRALTITADRNLSDHVALRVGLGHSFGDRDETSAQAGAIFRLPFGDVALSSEYAAPRDDWRIGIQMAFGMAFDPLQRRYRMTRPGPGTGGSAVVQAFIDRDGDDRYDPAIDEPAKGVTVGRGVDSVVTDDAGHAFVTGLGYSPRARLELNLDELDNPFVSTPPQTVEFVPRAGAVATVMYPLKPVGEVLARVQFRDAAGKLTGLSAVKVRVVRDGKTVAEALTEFDGSVVFDRLAVGRYRLELDPAQAAQLRMSLASAIEFRVEDNGGFVPDVIATVVFELQT